jgi:Ca-activated chloride channel family protein
MYKLRQNSMFRERLRRTLLLGWLSCAVCGIATAQIFNTPSSTGKFGGSMTSIDSIQSVGLDYNVFQINTQNGVPSSPLQSPSGSTSALDLKSPRKARTEYEKGYQLLMRKDLQAAIEHLTKSIAIYPNFVAAHNALGTAYLNLSQNPQALQEFARAIALDDHLPNSYLNLGCAQLVLKQYADAEVALKKASALAPLDLQLLIALTYGELLNRDYSGVVATAHQAHDGKHEGAAIVHYFAAVAWEAEDNLSEAQREMEILLKEYPESPVSGQFRQGLDQLKAEQVRRKQAKKQPFQIVSPSFNGLAVPTAEEVSQQKQQELQDLRERDQIAEAEAEPDPRCRDCGLAERDVSSGVSSSTAGSLQPRVDSSRPTIRVAVDEVALFFTATDHGRSITDLSASEIEIRDDSKPPAAIIAFRNETELPLRLGLIIDTSESVTDRFQFEQSAAVKFLETVAKGKDDLAFVVGVNNSVLLSQDFTADQTLTARAVGKLAPGGGTALWDAVAFAADKLAKHPEVQPVARILVVLSDGKDNSSSVTLKQAISSAQRGEVAVYTVSTRDGVHEEPNEFLGDHAMKTLSELTGGSAFLPGSVQRLNGSLAGLQEVIRGRYLVSYKPRAFELNGQYRAIDIKAEKDGHKLKVFTRKGYYASHDAN